MLYTDKIFIKAHQNRTNSYYNHSYDREVRYAICSKCGKILGEQVKYPNFDKVFHFSNEKDDYKYCPYCGHEYEFGSL